VNSRPFDSAEFDRLLSAWSDGSLTDPEWERFAAWLEGSAEARIAYVEYATLQAMLELAHVLPMVAESASAGLLQPGDGNRLPPAEGAEVVGPRPVAMPKTTAAVRNLSWPWPAFSIQSLIALALVAMVSATTLWIGWRTLSRASSRRENQTVAENRSPKPQGPEATASVADLVCTVNCRWAALAPKAGDRLHVGQTLHLVAGVAEIRFDAGAKVVVQSPAELTLQSGKCLRLNVGKLTAEITAKEARGFTVVTPEGTFADQGTEFGVEVAPDRSSRVHVFKGQVEVALNGASRPAAPYRLMSDTGARIEEDSQNMILVEDTGESFMRSADDAGRDKHVVAYWRFEDRSLGETLPDTRKNTRPVRAFVDSSFNGNDLFTFVPKERPQVSADVPAAVVLQTGATNNRCLNNTRTATEPFRNLYTHSPFSHASPIDIQKIAPAEWTIEASVKAKYLHRNNLTFVGRDTRPPSSPAVADGQLAFEIDIKGRFAVHFFDRNERPHEAVAEKLPLRANQWYHVAAISDGRALRIYVDVLDGKGYQLQAETELPATGSTALAKGSDAGEWTIGRGEKDYRPAKLFNGWIDEVRICDVALNPSQLLFAPKAAAKAAAKPRDGAKAN
jgi:ferric-dicitrate binding protein FerR (iron transport regulator)